MCGYYNKRISEQKKKKKKSDMLKRPKLSQFQRQCFKKGEKNISNGDVNSLPLISSMQCLTNTHCHDCNNMPVIPAVMNAVCPHAGTC